MLTFLESSDQSSRKIYDFLNFLKLTLSRSRPHTQTVSDVGENIGLNEKFPNVTGEIMPEFVQSHKNFVAFLDNCRNVRLPG